MEGKNVKQHLGEEVLYHMKTIYLITKSDLKTTLYPAATFGLASAVSGPSLITNSTPSVLGIVRRFPKTILWTWMNLWIFDLANQRLPDSILEGSVNKPWRAIPSGRLTSTQARTLLVLSIPMVFLSTFVLGGRDESMVVMILTWLYNDLGAGDENCLVRHILNTLGCAAFGAGATQVTCGFPKYTLNTNAYNWLAVIALAITCTIQFQDMEDQIGDRMRGRRTLLIVLGEIQTRWLNAVSIITFSILASIFWQSNAATNLILGLLAIVISGRTFLLHSVADDRQTFKLWCLWLITLYLLPLFKHYELSSRV